MNAIAIPSDLRQVMRENYDEIIDFVCSEPFKGLIEEMYTLPENQRPAYVSSKIVNLDYLASIGVDIPDGVLIQRSSFGDRRPTLFVVKKYLPKDYQVAWENVNLTFDQSHNKGSIPRDIAAWRKPLPYDVQAALQVLEVTPEDLE